MSRLPAPSRTPARPRFRVVRPEGDEVILPFPASGAHARISSPPELPSVDRFVSISQFKLPEGREALLSRARTLHRNRCCPNCRRGGVVPVDLGDGDDRHQAMPVPGTSTLVGFYCDGCGAEWPA
jgi:hypothetical protein